MNSLASLCRRQAVRRWVRIESTDGAIVAIDQSTHPVAIIDGDKPLCVTEDVDYRFVLEVDGPGAGTYMFGVWARPK